MTMILPYAHLVQYRSCLCDRYIYLYTDRYTYVSLSVIFLLTVPGCTFDHCNPASRHPSTATEICILAWYVPTIAGPNHYNRS